MINENINSTIIQNPSFLSTDELVDEYEKISKIYLKLKDYVEKSEQENFQLKRSLELSDKRESYLNQELESIVEIHDREIADVNHKHVSEMDDLRARLQNSKETIDTLEIEVERLKNEMSNRPAANLQEKCTTSKPNESMLSNSRLEYFEKMETDHVNLIQEMDDLKIKWMESMSEMAQTETKLENMTDCYDCAKENLKSKNDELEENRQIIDALQEKVIELSAELASYRTENVDQKKKGNSLFAEVDDQRQKMKETLALQKKHYLRMKREHQEGQFEIRRLKRENADMYRELKQCSNMFLNADKYHKDKLNERINFLCQEKEQLETKLRWMEAKLNELAQTHKITWLDSMLDYCRNETEKLKQQLYSCRLQKSEAEDGFVKAEEKASKWRFEALKSRCIIIDREMILEKHNIPFDTHMRNIEQMVQRKFKDGSNESPIIKVESILDVGNISITNTPNTTINWPQPDGCSIIMEDKEITLKQESFWEIDTSINHSAIENNVSANRTACDEFKISTEIFGELMVKSENKENTDITKSEQSLSNGLASKSPWTTLPQPQFREINIPSQRKQALKKLSETITNQTRDYTISDAATITVKSEFPSTLTEIAAGTVNNSSLESLRVEQKPTRPRLMIKHITIKRE